VNAPLNVPLLCARLLLRLDDATPRELERVAMMAYGALAGSRAALPPGLLPRAHAMLSGQGTAELRACARELLTAVRGEPWHPDYAWVAEASMVPACGLLRGHSASRSAAC
jgi:hypothetical protein